MEAMNVRNHVIVSGRVQGVGFRVSCRDVAERLGVTGTVSNLADGTVEIFAECSERAMKEFLAWCRTGPRYARVNSVAVSPEPPSGVRAFTII